MKNWKLATTTTMGCMLLITGCGRGTPTPVVLPPPPPPPQVQSTTPENRGEQNVPVKIDGVQAPPKLGRYCFSSVLYAKQLTLCGLTPRHCEDLRTAMSDSFMSQPGLPSREFTACTEFVGTTWHFWVKINGEYKAFIIAKSDESCAESSKLIGAEEWPYRLTSCQSQAAGVPSFDSDVLQFSCFYAGNRGLGSYCGTTSEHCNDLRALTAKQMPGTVLTACQEPLEPVWEFWWMTTDGGAIPAWAGTEGACNDRVARMSPKGIINRRFVLKGCERVTRRRP
jgi:hypothetical protein